MRILNRQNLKVTAKLSLQGWIMENNEELRVIKGGLAVDDRGELAFINDFDFKGVKRFYMVKNFSTGNIRAFHGHMKEAKYAYVPKGAALIVIAKMKSETELDKSEEPKRFVISENSPSVLYIPPGHANGFRSLTDDTKIIFYSTTTLDESKGDDYRFDFDEFGTSIWESKHR